MVSEDRSMLQKKKAYVVLSSAPVKPREPNLRSFLDKSILKDRELSQK
jgi:hypothetical protein